MRQSPARRVTAWQFTAEIPSSPAERQPSAPTQQNRSAPIERASQTMIDGQVVSPDSASAPNRESRSDVSASANLQPQPPGTQLCSPSQLGSENRRSGQFQAATTRNANSVILLARGRQHAIGNGFCSKHGCTSLPANEPAHRYQVSPLILCGRLLPCRMEIGRGLWNDKSGRRN
jgi:hypothetical protein